jgi:hypothetical protein
MHQLKRWRGILGSENHLACLFVHRPSVSSALRMRWLQQDLLLNPFG